jgi:hypothetical protein
MDESPCMDGCTCMDESTVLEDDALMRLESANSRPPLTRRFRSEMTAYTQF